MFVKSLLSNVVSFRGGRTQFYNGKLIAVPNDTEQEFKYTTNLHIEKSLKNENELRCFDLKNDLAFIKCKAKPLAKVSNKKKKVKSLTPSAFYIN